MKIFRFLVFLIMLITGQFTYATTFSLFASKYATLTALPVTLEQLVNANLDASSYREIKAQVIYRRDLKPDHVLVFLFVKNQHRVDVARINVTSQFKKIDFIKDYELTEEDFGQQPITEIKCPDPKIEFIVFSPNQDKFEQGISKIVANYAANHGLTVARYLGKTATRQNYLNAMACPLLKGNFYDGDGSPHFITAADGIVSARDINGLLAKKFHFKVMNIWIACDAFREPMKTTMLLSAQSQKYAAGINDLDVGNSDRTAGCAMLAAIDGKPITAAFYDCYKRFDTKSDHWGLEGYGTEYFGL